MQHIAYSFNDASEEDKQLIKSTILLELSEGSYLTRHSLNHETFEECLQDFFQCFLEEEVDLNSFWFGKTILECIKKVQGDQ
jgi:hypothetical protein